MTEVKKPAAKKPAKVQVVLLAFYSGVDVRSPGETLELDADEARQLIDLGAAKAA